MSPEACITIEELASELALLLDWTMWIAPLFIFLVGYLIGFLHARDRYKPYLEDVG